MPLRAIIEGDEVLAPLFDDTNWIELKRRVKAEKLEVEMICCGNPGYLRTSKHGYHHFVHKIRGGCDSKPETWQHLKAKQEIVRACKSAGYEAKTEVEGNGWRADVLAVRGKIKIAFEVQWSPQTWETTVERQEKFIEDGIRCCWLFKSPPPDYSANEKIPLFKIQVTDEDCDIIFNPRSYKEWHEDENRTIPISNFIQFLLKGKIRFCPSLRSKRRQPIHMTFPEIYCWKCHRSYHVYYLHDLKTDCGKIINASDSTHNEDKYYFSPQFIAMALSFIETDQGKRIKLGFIKKRYSRTIEVEYMSFGCPHCDALCGDFFFQREIIPSVLYEPEVERIFLKKVITLSERIYKPHDHWCFPDNGEFCCGK